MKKLLAILICIWILAMIGSARNNDVNKPYVLTHIQAGKCWVVMLDENNEITNISTTLNIESCN